MSYNDPWANYAVKKDKPCKKKKKKVRRSSDPFDGLFPGPEFQPPVPLPPPVPIADPANGIHIPLDDEEDAHARVESFDELSSCSDSESGAKGFTALKTNANAEGEADRDEEPVLVKRLYQGKRKCKCCVNWVTEAPKGFSNASESKQDKKTDAVLIRYSSIFANGEASYPLHSVVVKSPLIKDILRPLLEDYPGINIGHKDVKFSPPLSPLVHVWDDLVRAAHSEEDSVAKEQVVAFCEALEPHVGETFKDRNDLTSRGLITHELLWTLYPPNSLIVCDFSGGQHLMRVIETRSEPLCTAIPQWSLRLNVEYLDWDGDQYDYREWNVYIDEFKGTKKISDLATLPLAYLPDHEKLLAGFVERGRLASTLVNAGYKTCKGFITHVGDIGESVGRTWIDGRVFIDYNEFDKVFNYARPGSRSIKEDVQDMTDEQLALCCGFVRGFSFSTKHWAKFDVETLADVKWNDQAFQQLVMPSRRKRLIRALVDKSQDALAATDDIIAGKGLGLIMLLQGPPGTGKTLTAESIADRMRMPLYSVGASELNFHGRRDPESTLSAILEKAASWKAVLLIDEADAFLEQRNNYDMERNKRVAVFLRLLENFKGVLILTTNRAIRFDDAFNSRIHLTLRFERLDESARAAVWRTFMRTRTHNVSEAEIDVLAQMQLNGRQIKNVLKMAHLLAHSEEQTLEMQHLTDVLEVMELGEEEPDDSDIERPSSPRISCCTSSEC